jgi:hypothetical protein
MNVREKNGRTVCGAAIEGLGQLPSHPEGNEWRPHPARGARPLLSSESLIQINERD